MRLAVTVSDAIARLWPEMPVRFVAYDGSEAGPPDAEVTFDLRTPKGLSYLLTAPGDLGLARAYVSGDLVVHGISPGNPYEVLSRLKAHTDAARPSPAEVLRVVNALGWRHLRPPPPPPQETLPQWRRAAEGLRLARGREAAVISHHYDVSNRFYELVLGPSLTYTCAVFAHHDATLEEAQAEKYDLIARKLDLRPGQRLFDVGCGWGGMVIHAAREYGVRALGVTLSREQEAWAAAAIDRAGLSDLVEVRYQDYRDVPESDFDAITSIGMMEHVGVRNYPAYFTALSDRLRPGGRLLNHCITRPHNRSVSTGAFIDRYVFPDGELTGAGRIITEAQDAGLELQHVENLREHYALTLAEWSRNLDQHWEECVAEVGEGTARVWGLYLVGARIAFERNEIELHQVLASRTPESGEPAFPLRPTWLS